MNRWTCRAIVAVGGSALLLAIVPATTAELDLGPEEIVQADGSTIDVPGYSVPSMTPWNADPLPDLIVGEGSGSFPAAKVRVYLNVGAAGDPRFEQFFYAQSEGADLTFSGAG